MKLYLYFLIIILVASVSKISSQEIFAEQTWELSKDINNDGWVNQGDIITFQVDITHNGKVAETISIDNLVEHEGLELIPKSVSIAKGTILKGSNVSDKTIHVKDVKLEAPWGYATLAFSARVTSDPEESSSAISNHTILSTSIGPISSNSIEIPRRTGYTAKNSSQLFTTILSLLGLLTLGVLLGFASKRFRVAKIAKSHV